ncbi:hypothetical protein DSO57_1031213 [Entomophthora muscae]|uniref:Uncharacterized protein n=1 Tax=Entomophthora muscae TaxID=34485 RepID=A0ACC2S2T1_9FUNG|nr:hypothetical protein DSO57_1031213 [Entomophthora muscae]
MMAGSGSEEHQGKGEEIGYWAYAPHSDPISQAITHLQLMVRFKSTIAASRQDFMLAPPDVLRTNVQAISYSTTDKIKTLDG